MFGSLASKHHESGPNPFATVMAKASQVAATKMTNPTFRETAFGDAGL
jgi:hypothetical protein